MADKKRDYYEVLGIEKSASKDEIKKAYRKITKENHPDLHPGDKACEERFKEANEAYEVLYDDDKRKKYDQYGHAAFDPNAGFGGAGFDFGDLGDIFGDIFGGGFGGFGGFGGGSARRSDPNAPRRGSDIRTSLNISFEEAAFGCEKQVQVGIVEKCPDCSGSGCAPGSSPDTCSECNGSGQVVTQQRTVFGMAQSVGKCPKCNGRGKIIHNPCKTCHGMGNIRKQHKINVKIPAGIDDGQTLPIHGKGNAGVNGGDPGDLYISMIVRPSAIFEREGTTIYYEAEISYPEAVLGAEVEIPTIDGKVKLTIPEGTQPGATFRIKGKGVPYIGHDSIRGDQFVAVKIGVPKHLTNDQKEKLKAFADSINGSSNLKSKIFGKK